MSVSCGNYPWKAVASDQSGQFVAAVSHNYMYTSNNYGASFSKVSALTSGLQLSTVASDCTGQRLIVG